MNVVPRPLRAWISGGNGTPTSAGAWRVRPSKPTSSGRPRRRKPGARRPSVKRVASWAGALVLVTGCGAIDHELQRRVAAEAANLSPPVEDDAAVVQVAADTADGRSSLPSAEGLPPEAGLDDYVHVALTENPAIRQAIRRVQVLGWRVPQVTSLDDPMINLIPPTGDMIQTAAGMMEGSAGISQKIPFPGKLSARGRIVEESIRMALYDLAEVRIATVARVQKAYDAYYLAHVSIQITRESEGLLRQIRDVAAARYRSGTATQQDVLRAEVELYELVNRLITLEQERATAAALLNSLMDRAVDAPLPPPKEFELERVGWELPEAIASAVESNPGLARLQAQIERDLESIQLAKLGYFPDLTVGYNYTFIGGTGVSPVATGNDAWNLAFGINLPIWWQRLRARVLEANAQTLASVEGYEDLRNGLFFQIQDTLVKIDTQYRQAILFRDLIVPRAWQTVEVSTSAYQAGALEFTALIDNWRKWLDSLLAYQRSLAGLEQHFADLQQLIGIRVPRNAAEPASSGTTSTGEPSDERSDDR
jgi:outer membrane protein, heavy metal efflux system